MASGKDASVIVWIVKHARDEHRSAVEWLNDRTDENVGFYLVEVEVWRIGASAPAVKFNVVERPNGWAKTQKEAAKLTSSDQLRLQFWTDFREYAASRADIKSRFSLRKPDKYSWYAFAIGISGSYVELSMSTTKKRVSAALYYMDGKEWSFKLKDEHEMRICIPSARS